MAAGRRDREQSSDHIFADPSPQPRRGAREQIPLDANDGSFDGGGGGGTDARNHPRSTVADLRDYAAGECEGEEEEEGYAVSNHRSWVDNIGSENAAGRTSSRENQHPHQRKFDALQGRVEPAAAAAGKQNYSPVNMNDIMHHVAAKDARAYSATAGRSGGGMPEEHAQDERAQDVNGGDDDGGGVAEQDRSPAARALTSDSEARGGGGGGGEDPPDQAYMHSLAYGNLGSVLPILLDRRSALEVSADQLSIGGLS